MSILFTALEVLFAAVAAVVLLSYAIAWYEYANRLPELVAERFAPRRLAAAAGLVAMEIGFLFVTVLLHPLGWYAPRETRAERGDGTPVILLHGLFHNRACWLWTRYRLRRQGFTALHAINLPPWKDVESLTERLAKKVDELRHATGIDRVHLVGHSMGGIIARNYLQIRGGAHKVDRCVLLASPNGGSKLAPFALTPLGTLLLPGSAFLQRLAEAPLPPAVRLTAVVNRHDNMVLPFEHARLEGAHNVELSGMGHASVLYHPRATAAIVAALTEEAP